MNLYPIHCPPNLTAREKWIGKQSDTRVMIDKLDGDADFWDNHDFNEGIATGWDDASEKEEEENKIVSFKDNREQEKQLVSKSTATKTIENL